MYQKVKKVLDKVIALILLIILAIPMLIVMIAIKAEDNGPVIFKQRRVGYKNKVFEIYKFRTMKINRRNNLTHEQMVTKVGAFLRKTSIDELPQLINVLKGDMSFIGPRPWIEDYYPLFTEEQKHRTDLLPGLTGLAQAKGRNSIDIFQKIEYDLEYIHNANFKLDLKIIYWTIKSIFKKEDVEITEVGIKQELEALKKFNTIRTSYKTL